jgi:outer membrane scaffolding protein for murein synthesis (MipA/OmpV family)
MLVSNQTATPRRRAVSTLFIATMSLSMVLAAPLSAASDVLVPLPSISDFTTGDGWGVALGAGVEYEAVYDGSDEYEFEVEPAGAVQWRNGDNLFFWEGIELGWRGLLAPRALLQAGLRYEDGLEPDDSDDGRLDGIAPRDSHTVGFVEYRHGLGEGWRNWLGARVMGASSDFGWLGVLAAGHRFGDRNDGTGSEMFAFVTFGDADFINKDFGVTAEDSLSSGLPETVLDSGYRSTGVTLMHRANLGERLQLVGQAGVEFYSSDIADSPIVRDDYEYEVGVSLLYRF